MLLKWTYGSDYVSFNDWNNNKKQLLGIYMTWCRVIALGFRIKDNFKNLFPKTNRININLCLGLFLLMNISKTKLGDMVQKVMGRIFQFIRKNFISIGYLNSLPFAILAIYIHIYYHYNQGARFGKEPLPLSHVYKFEGVDFEEFNFKTPDNAIINAGLFKNPDQPSRGVIYFFHGNAGNVGKNINLAPHFFTYGYDVMVIDWRGYGKSIGKRSEKAFYDDSQLVYEALLKRYPEDKIYLMGHSFGCAMAANIGTRNNPAAVILVGPLYSFADAQQNCPWYYPIITEYPFRTDLFVPQIKSPIYLFSGTSDIVHEASVRLSKLLREKDKFIEIKGANHTNIFFDFPDFKSHLQKILNPGKDDILVLNRENQVIKESKESPSM